MSRSVLILSMLFAFLFGAVAPAVPHAIDLFDVASSSSDSDTSETDSELKSDGQSIIGELFEIKKPSVVLHATKIESFYSFHLPLPMVFSLDRPPKA